MKRKPIIAIDAMGGDRGVTEVANGVARYLDDGGDSSFLVYGIEDELQREFARNHLLDKVTIRPTKSVIGMEDKPSQAIRRGRDSSMWQAIAAVKEGEADAIWSGGNTGTLMAMSYLQLSVIKEVSRPAIAAQWPTISGSCVMLDLGANISSDSAQLIDNALMGAAMARAVLGLKRPRVGLLNIGVEDTKGHESIREAGIILSKLDVSNMTYIGFVEADKIGTGIADVVVSEGFTGNIALKSAEGTARQLAGYIREAVQDSWAARIGFLLARKSFGRLREKMDPNKVNGGLFLGLNSLVIKSHGSANGVGVGASISMLDRMYRADVIENIVADLKDHGASRLVTGDQTNSD